MKLLSGRAFSAAKQYLEKQGREVDLAWYKMEFENGTRQEAAEKLKAYQCSNGGFGQALEPDHRTALPSCYATSVAFDWFENLGLSGEDDIVKKALAFLGENYNSVTVRWPAFPRKANSDPHAVWWHYEEGEEYCPAEKSWGLPSAQITGILLKYEPDNRLWQDVFETAVKRLDNVCPEMELTEANLYMKMYDYLDNDRKKIIGGNLSRVLGYIMEANENKWNEHSAKPLMYVTDPGSPFYITFRDLVNKNLDWEIDAQTGEGCWEPAWQWRRDEKHWLQARHEWKSYLTAEKLVLLKRFTRIEE